MQSQNIRIRLKAFDHRILDGAEGGAFLSAVKQRLEDFGADSILF